MKEVQSQTPLDAGLVTLGRHTHRIAVMVATARQRDVASPKLAKRKKHNENEEDDDENI